ncbi:hypothetical protein AcW1_007862 [Taiwanofungus camphoratus]|nr:hypothetical protein AcW2_007080 [Antrodia cinnamomea]KAI0923279.1 hypothetical protein AcV7_005834 [Antrodia cinnamomea]KAI0926690.1 hypothetical protein AcV5_007415 [Antrodia cinnamomea]KAI0953712.1 hypothetical protein AcW1_007862 [Antrodia cinnamomea]
MSQPIIYRTPPIAGRPPYATDEPDSMFQQQPNNARRIRQQPPPDPNARTSAYNVYDQYLDGNNQGIEAGSLENPFDDSKQLKSPQLQHQLIPLAAPKPGYAAPVAALNLSRPSPVASPDGRQPASPEMSQVTYPKPLTLVTQQSSPRITSPISTGGIPSTPHPLQPPMTPITPAFIRPSNSPAPRDIKFAHTEPILRGEKEDLLLPKRGPQGEDFWRRFSMVAKEDNGKPYAQKQSAWLRKTTNGTSRMSRSVLIGGLLLLLVIIAAIVFGVWEAKKNTTPSTPTAIGGSANELNLGTSSSGAPHASGSASLHVSPTNTVARRDILSDIVPTGLPLPPVPVVPPKAEGSAHVIRVVPPARHRRSHINRTLD